MIGCRTALVGLAAGGLLASCMDDRHVGNTTQTENTAAARTLRVDSLLPCWNRPFFGATVATLKLDSSNFDFQETDSAGRDLAVQRLSGDAVPFSIDGWDKAARRGRLYVRIDSQDQKPGARLLLRWKQELTDRANDDSVWHQIPAAQRLALQSVLVADFESKSDTSDLPTHSVWQFFVNDTAVKPPFRYEAAGTGSGTALHLDSANLVRGTIVFKLPLVRGETPRSIRAMDSVVFWIKGTRNASVFFAFDQASYYKTWQLDTIDNVWTRVRYRPTDMVPASDPNGGNRGWNAVRDSITYLTFLPNGDVKDLWIDDIRIYGLDRDDLR